ncbi:hypothetical protein N0V86_002624 [Didymella sp. IMI 355093]|nr:hypothetical protein N0V86_002624 [Didymella sp. IMI 355093]
MGNQKYFHYDSKGQLDKFEICYQYRCGWDTGVSFTHVIREKQRSTYFCINFPSGARERLEAIFRYESRRTVLHRDFFIDTLVADDSLKQWQIEIGERRLMLLGIEEILEEPSKDGDSSETPKENLELNGKANLPASSKPKNLYNDEERDVGMRAGPSVTGPSRVNTEGYWKREILKSFGGPGKPEEIDFDKATRHLHKMVRHWLGIRQDCEDLLAQLQFLQKTYNLIEEKRGMGWIYDYGVDARESFELFHLANQRMAVLNQNMAEANQRTALDTATIAEETKRDSASMITLAAVTMVFLPGTFVCTIVSTNFFDFGEQELQVSGKWWTLLVVGVPLTLIVFGVWYKWTQWRFEKQDKKRRQREITAVKSL